MISLDVSILEPGSPSAKRIGEYGSICDELHIIVLNGKGVKNKELAKNVFVEPAGSSGRFLSIFKAIVAGKKILSDKSGGWFVTCQDPFETGFVGWRLAKKFKIPLEIQLHGDFYGSKYWKHESFFNFFRFYLGKFILRRANSIRTVSERIKKTISGDKVFVLPIYSDLCGVAKNHSFLKDKFLGAFPIILAVGNLVPVKNHKLLIKVFAEIKKKLPKAKLVIAGEGPLKKRLQLIAYSLQLGEEVFFAGKQNNLADYYSSADIFVHPSLHEGWGRAVIEAAYFGLPIVMSDAGLAGEAIINGESGLVVPVNNAVALREAITELAQNDELRERLISGAKRVAELSLTKGAFFAKIKESWEAVLGGKI